MNYEIFLKELESLEQNIFSKTDEEIDFTLLNIVKYILEEKEQKQKTERELLLQQELTEVIDSIVQRPEYYFETKERNMEKLIETKLTNNILPKTKEDKFATHAETNINTMVKLFDEITAITKDDELKYHLEECKKDLKKIRVREDKKELKLKVRKVVKMARVILEKEITKEKPMEI